MRVCLEMGGAFSSHEGLAGGCLSSALAKAAERSTSEQIRNRRPDMEPPEPKLRFIIALRGWTERKHGERELLNEVHAFLINRKPRSSFPGFSRNSAPAALRCINSRGVGSPELPLFPQQARDLIPVAVNQGAVHGAGYQGNLFEVAEYVAVAIDVRLEHFPIVDAGFAWRPRIGEHEPGFNLLWGNRDSLAVNAVDVEVDGTDPAVKGRIVVLAARGHVDDLRFDVLGNHPHLLPGKH